jgi:hypothetical protein
MKTAIIIGGAVAATLATLAVLKKVAPTIHAKVA